eukprot:TRINITY_DN447_c0_g1_i2.p1 TRINITY_DN447_c0_g1~~TRINITY_DN447_c0_g1_i2.p1  ORF type:complete len:306 (-),score=48.23 TRINITY_DN447_c0_g1_i2:105-1022(-)
MKDINQKRKQNNTNILLEKQTYPIERSSGLTKKIENILQRKNEDEKVSFLREFDRGRRGERREVLGSKGDGSRVEDEVESAAYVLRAMIGSIRGNQNKGKTEGVISKHLVLAERISPPPKSCVFPERPDKVICIDIDEENGEGFEWGLGEAKKNQYSVRRTNIGEYHTKCPSFLQPCFNQKGQRNPMLFEVNHKVRPLTDPVIIGKLGHAQSHTVWYFPYQPTTDEPRTKSKNLRNAPDELGKAEHQYPPFLTIPLVSFTPPLLRGDSSNPSLSRKRKATAITPSDNGTKPFTWERVRKKKNIET